MALTIQTLALNVRLSCQLLNVPESSYYERINRHPSKTQLRRQYLSLKISQLFNANRGIYGAPKIHHLLLKQGEKVGLLPHIKVEEKLHELAEAAEQTFVVTGVPDGRKGERLVVLHTLPEEQLKDCLEKL